MSSIGASCAEVYVMKKRHKERLQRREEERVRRGNEVGVIEETERVKGGGGGSVFLRINKSKIHPGNFSGVVNDLDDQSARRGGDDGVNNLCNLFIKFKFAARALVDLLIVILVE
ncbi:hypothetical protein EZV62_015100 [Acer yangbiense]|uniref:Uncharacterized protein n=1 Tax=Acer yangbiense TaxID=1000413 RepID=A0A5C7HTT0_9ROSI|nr:hypothetical protein EZV62_015100 [Acer yangbiense]